MRPMTRLLALPAVLAVAVTLSGAGMAPALATDRGPDPAADRAAARLQERRQWATRVREMRSQERAELDSLARELAALAPGADQARGQRELEESKRAWRRRMLQAQIERAQSAGTPANAARLKARLVELDARGVQRAAARAAGGER